MAASTDGSTCARSQETKVLPGPAVKQLRQVFKPVPSSSALAKFCKAGLETAIRPVLAFSVEILISG